jgi:hypothetical protein
MSCVTLPNGMEEVIASVFIRSTNYFNDLWVLRKLPEGPQGFNKRIPLISRPCGSSTNGAASLSRETRERS